MVLPTAAVGFSSAGISRALGDPDAWMKTREKIGRRGEKKEKKMLRVDGGEMNTTLLLDMGEQMVGLLTAPKVRMSVERRRQRAVNNSPGKEEIDGTLLLEDFPLNQKRVLSKLKWGRKLMGTVGTMTMRMMMKKRKKRTRKRKEKRMRGVSLPSKPMRMMMLVRRKEKKKRGNEKKKTMSKKKKKAKGKKRRSAERYRRDV